MKSASRKYITAIASKAGQEYFISGIKPGKTLLSVS